MNRLTSPTVVQELMARHGASFTKSLGQNFLIDENILQKIVDASAIGPGDRVLEVGPGIGVLTQAMARELSPYGIRVLSVAPGWVKTGMIDKPIEEIGSRLHMKGRIILPEEIANVIWLMSLPEASAINGTTIMADDGYSSFKGVDGFQAE